MRQQEYLPGVCTAPGQEDFGTQAQDYNTVTSCSLSARVCDELTTSTHHLLKKSLKNSKINKQVTLWNVNFSLTYCFKLLSAACCQLKREREKKKELAWATICNLCMFGATNFYKKYIFLFFSSRHNKYKLLRTYLTFFWWISNSVPLTGL